MLHWSASSLFTVVIHQYYSHTWLPNILWIDILLNYAQQQLDEAATVLNMSMTYCAVIILGNVFVYWNISVFPNWILQ